MNKHFTIAIDGPAGAGKSTVAKTVAARLDAIYLDTGAMYRSVGLYMLRNGVDPKDSETVSARAHEAKVDIRYVDGSQHVYLCGEDVSKAIRENHISAAASGVSAVPRVREILVARQQEIAKEQSVVMDGRDIGTKVLPDATLKIFLTASAEERARRRFEELKEKGKPVPYSEEAARQRAVIAAKYGFTDIRWAMFHRTRTFTAAEYIQLLGTYSDHIAIDAPTRNRFFSAIEAAINRHGGLFTIYDTIDLQLARKP